MSATTEKQLLTEMDRLYELLLEARSILARQHSSLNFSLTRELPEKMKCNLRSRAHQIGELLKRMGGEALC